MRLSVCSLFVLLCLPATSLAQTVTNPTLVEFTPSADHAVLNSLTGVPVVTNYEFDAVAQNSVGAIALTVGLGKPAPNAAGLISVSIAQLSTLTPNVIYTAVVKAIGPDGAGVSAPSNPFGRVAPLVPAIATNVKVK